MHLFQSSASLIIHQSSRKPVKFAWLLPAFLYFALRLVITILGKTNLSSTSLTKLILPERDFFIKKEDKPAPNDDE